MNALPLTAALVALLLSSCTSPKVGPAAPRVYWMGTPEYKAQVARLNLSRAEADKRLRKYYGFKPYPLLRAWEAALVDDWYHLRGPTEADVCLSGWYVHGITGAIQHRGARHDVLEYRGQPGNFRWVHVKNLQGRSDQGKVSQLPHHLRRKAERNFPTGFLMPSLPKVESKLPRGGDLDRPSTRDIEERVMW
ncbi:hypothetical protein [Roseimicrobium gellanilyticum]|nr:hypothetical protein [Roseimicrobium gellanilyticum]